MGINGPPDCGDCCKGKNHAITMSYCGVVLRKG